MENWNTIDWVVLSMMITMGLGVLLLPVIFFMVLRQGDFVTYGEDDE